MLRAPLSRVEGRGSAPVLRAPLLGVEGRGAALVLGAPLLGGGGRRPVGRLLRPFSLRRALWPGVRTEPAPSAAPARQALRWGPVMARDPASQRAWAPTTRCWPRRCPAPSSSARTCGSCPQVRPRPPPGAASLDEPVPLQGLEGWAGWEGCEGRGLRGAGWPPAGLSGLPVASNLRRAE